MSSFALRALVEKPPTSTSSSVTPCFRLENRLPTWSGPATWRSYFFWMSAKSSDGAGSVSSSSVPVAVAYSQWIRSSMRSRISLQIGQRQQRRRVILDERALRLPAGAHRADQIARIEPDARGEIVDQPFGGGQLLGVAGPARVDDHAQVLQARHAPAQLADRDDAGRVARQAAPRSRCAGCRRAAPSATTPGSPAAPPAATESFRDGGSTRRNGGWRDRDDVDRAARGALNIACESARVAGTRGMSHDDVVIGSRSLDAAVRSRSFWILRPGPPGPALLRLSRGARRLRHAGLGLRQAGARAVLVPARERGRRREVGGLQLRGREAARRDPRARRAGRGPAPRRRRLPRRRGGAHSGATRLRRRLPGRAGARGAAGAAALLRRRGRMAGVRHRAQLREAAQPASRRSAACPRSASRSPTPW